jgi:hypothetical protein
LRHTHVLFRNWPCVSCKGCRGDDGIFDCTACPYKDKLGEFTDYIMKRTAAKYEAEPEEDGDSGGADDVNKDGDDNAAWEEETEEQLRVRRLGGGGEYIAFA